MAPTTFLDTPYRHGSPTDGVQIGDLNGDGLDDMSFAFVDLLDKPGHGWNCVYINTGCGWVLQANYTGPVTSCAPPSSVVVAGVEFFWRPHDTVASLVADVRASLRLDAESVWLESSASRARVSEGSPIAAVVRAGGFTLHAGALGSARVGRINSLPGTL